MSAAFNLNFSTENILCYILSVLFGAIQAHAYRWTTSALEVEEWGFFLPLLIFCYSELVLPVVYSSQII